jgi:calcium permeable stress-gated cation channel
MYIEQICLAVLFFLKISDGIVFIVEGVLMVILMALTLSAQILYRRSFLREYQSLSCPRLL